MTEFIRKNKKVISITQTDMKPQSSKLKMRPIAKIQPQKIIAQNKYSLQTLLKTEDLARDLVFAIDPVIFSREALGTTPDTWQAQVLRSSSRRILLNCSRQSGKSTIAAILALHHSLFFPNSLVLLVSPSLRQSSELFRKVTDLFCHLPNPPAKMEDNRLSCTFQNGSRIVSLPGNEETIRGFSAVSLVVEDEAARVPDNLYRAVRPMLAVSRGRIILMSTPFGKRGHFFEEWKGINQWERVEIPASKCKRISREFLEEEHRALGDWWYRQEYECEFVHTSDQVFSYDLIMSAISDDIEPLFPIDSSHRISLSAPSNVINTDIKPLF